MFTSFIILDLQFEPGKFVKGEAQSLVDRSQTPNGMCDVRVTSFTVIEHIRVRVPPHAHFLS